MLLLLIGTLISINPLLVKLIIEIIKLSDNLSWSNLNSLSLLISIILLAFLSFLTLLCFLSSFLCLLSSCIFFISSLLSSFFFWTKWCLSIELFIEWFDVFWNLVLMQRFVFIDPISSLLKHVFHYINTLVFFDFITKKDFGILISFIVILLYKLPLLPSLIGFFNWIVSLFFWSLFLSHHTKEFHFFCS